jgi:esterase/lipase superfamily enzyme
VTVKATERWWSQRLRQPIGLARWGHHGSPVLVFPTGGGDAEEVEHNALIGACWPLIESAGWPRCRRPTGNPRRTGPWC